MILLPIIIICFYLSIGLGVAYRMNSFFKIGLKRWLEVILLWPFNL